MDKEPMSTQREREEREGGLQGSTKNAGEAVTSRIEWMMPAKPWGGGALPPALDNFRGSSPSKCYKRSVLVQTTETPT